MAKILKIVYLLYALKLAGQVQGQEVPTSAPSTVQLGSYRVNKDFITLSGFSSGGSFAQQLYFSYSNLIHGIAVFSHTHYRCGPVTSSQEVFDNTCTRLGNSSQLYDLNNVFTDINDYLSRGLIENPNQMRNKPLYIYVGTSNWLFSPEMSFRIRELFRPFIENDQAIRSVVQDANLTLPTNRPEYPACSAPTNDVSLSNCGFSGAFDALQFLLGPNAVRESQQSPRLEPLLTFDQTELFYGFDGSNNNGARHDMDSVGYLYVPRICKEGNVNCLLHFYFHGCNVGREFVGAAHIQNSGFLEVAESNGIIMVFPQVISSLEIDIGCWDTYGFTGPLYATKRGAQVTVVRNMLSRILQEEQRPTTPLPVSTLGSPQPTQQTGSDFVSRYLQPHSEIFRYLENLRNF